MTVTSSLPSPASAPLAVRTTPPSANRGSRWFLKWTLAARAAAVMVRVRTIEKIAERFMRQLSFSCRAWIAECFSSPAYGRTGGRPGARRERASSDHRSHNPSRRDDVVLDREERRRLATLEDAGGDEHPARVTDGGDHLPLLRGFAHETDHRGMTAHHVRRVAAGHDDRVELDGLHLLGLRVHIHRIAVLGGVGLGAAGPDHLHIRAFLAQTVVRHPELHLLVHVLGENRDPLAFQLHGPSFRICATSGKRTCRRAAGAIVRRTRGTWRLPCRAR